MKFNEMHTCMRDSSTSLCIGYGTQVRVKVYWPLVKNISVRISSIHWFSNCYQFLIQFNKKNPKKLKDGNTKTFIAIHNL